MEEYRVKREEIEKTLEELEKELKVGKTRKTDDRRNWGE